MLKEFNELISMGVINVTPNSFSNLEINLSEVQNQNILKETLRHFMGLKGCALDIGLESTAPMNKSISAELERERFLYFLKSTGELDFNEQWISFDTYRPENYLYFEQEFKKRSKSSGYIFNDVSGVIDDELINLLNSKKSDKNFRYVYTFSHIPSRDKVLDHMNFLRKENIVQLALEHFIKGMKIFKEMGVEEKIIFDPGYGFSKTYDQNWQLIHEFDLLLTKLEELDFKVPWLLGLSKKSFLRKGLEHLPDPFSASEELHAMTIKELIKRGRGQQLLFRAHDPKIVERAHAGL